LSESKILWAAIRLSLLRRDDDVVVELDEASGGGILSVDCVSVMRRKGKKERDREYRRQ